MRSGLRRSKSIQYVRRQMVSKFASTPSRGFYVSSFNPSNGSVVKPDSKFRVEFSRVPNESSVVYPNVTLETSLGTNVPSNIVKVSDNIYDIVPKSSLPTGRYFLKIKDITRQSNGEKIASTTAEYSVGASMFLAETLASYL